MTTPTVTYDLAKDASARRGWYLQSRDRFLAGLVRRIGDAATRTVLDAGCGPGGLAALLARSGLDVIGIDADQASLAHGSRKGNLAKPVRGSLRALPFKDNSFDICISSEVLEHVQDDAAALRELLRACRGPVIVTVPAHPYLWTDSDAILLHHRRYTRDDIRKLVDRAGVGCSVSRIAAYALVPGLGVLLYRWIGRFSHRAASKTDNDGAVPLAARFALPRWADAILSAMFRFELFLSARGLIPWGHGWWFVVQRNKSAL